MAASNNLLYVVFTDEISIIALDLENYSLGEIQKTF